MQVEVASIAKLLGHRNHPFFIPPFQRAYAWGTPELTRFFNDVCKLLQSEWSDEHNKQEHFFGTLVIQDERVSLGQSNIILVDGQQRITTSLIFIIALRDLLCKTEEDRDSINRVYLTSSNSPYDCGLKLKQVTSDWESYKAIFNGDKVPEGRIKDAYYHFYKSIQALQKEQEEQGRTLSFMDFECVLGRINLAVICLSEEPHKGEDPQIIFETLNSLGKPLTLADLIRNYILMGLPSEEQTKAYDQEFYPKIEKVLPDPLASEFFRDFTQCCVAEKVLAVDKQQSNAKDIYALFKDRVVPMYADRWTLINQLTAHATLYRYIIDPDFLPSDFAYTEGAGRQIKRLINNIFQSITTDPFKSLVLGLLAAHQGLTSEGRLADWQLIDSLKAIQTYLIRRRIIKVRAGENIDIPRVCKEIPKITAGEVTMLEILSRRSYNLRLPNDLEVAASLKTQPFYIEQRKHGKFILGMMEQRMGKVSVDMHTTAVTIEHVMPQKLTPYWRTELGPECDRIHQELLHNIGNLILTEFNSEIGNKTFAAKKATLQKSNLSYRHDLDDFQKWNEDAILQHRDVMIERFLQTFPLPEEMQKVENWSERESRKGGDERIFPGGDPNDFGQATGRKPINIQIEGEVYWTTLWYECLLAIFQHVKKAHPDLYHKLITDDTTPLKAGTNPEVRKWHPALMEMTPTEGDPFWIQHTTVDGTKLLDAIREEYTGDRRLFFRIAPKSAVQCMRSISQVMDYWGMNEKDVVITLRPEDEEDEE